jgi:hypothetical protein
MSKLTVRRRDNELRPTEDEQDETPETLSQMLDRKRADALAAEEDEKRADQMDALDAQMKRPITAQDLQRKIGGETTGVIDKFFSELN